MAVIKFTKVILNGEAIDVYNHGQMQRDFTYIDDIIQGLVKTIDKIPATQTNEYSTATAPYKLYNIGNNNPVTLERFIAAIEESTGKKANQNLLPMQAGDVPITYADVDDLIEDIGFKPETPIEQGIDHFYQWYKSVYT